MQCIAVHKPNMVSAAFVLFTVSALAVHGMDAPTGGPLVPPECQGKTYCNVKGDDYPHHEIDQLLARNLTMIHRMKREATDFDVPAPEPGSRGGNCETETRVEAPFYLTREGMVPQVIVQSQFFKQTIPNVNCKRIRNANCFEDLIRVGSEISAKCVQKTSTARLFIYVEERNEIMPIDTEINIDCVCVVV